MVRQLYLYLCPKFSVTIVFRTCRKEHHDPQLRCLNLLGPLYRLAEPAGWFITAGRFPGLIVAGIAGTRLSRPARSRA